MKVIITQPGEIRAAICHSNDTAEYCFPVFMVLFIFVSINILLMGQSHMAIDS